MPLPGSAFAPEGSPVSLTLSPDTRSAALYRAVEHAFDAPFGAALNPLKHLGALGFLFFWLLVITGVVLYVVLDTSVEGAYKSINDLAQVPWGAARDEQGKAVIEDGCADARAEGEGEEPA